MSNFIPERIKIFNRAKINRKHILIVIIKCVIKLYDQLFDDHWWSFMIVNRLNSPIFNKQHEIIKFFDFLIKVFITKVNHRVKRYSWIWSWDQKKSQDRQIHLLKSYLTCSRWIKGANDNRTFISLTFISLRNTFTVHVVTIWKTNKNKQT